MSEQVAYGSVQAARGQLCKPAVQAHIDPRAKFLETETTSQRTHHAFGLEEMRRSRGERVKPPSDTPSPFCAKAPKAKFDGWSNAQASYGLKPLEDARGPSFKPACEVHIDPAAKFLVSRTSFRRDFPELDPGAAQESQGAAMPARAQQASVIGGMIFPKGRSAEESKSAYQRQFSKAPDLLAARRENYKPAVQVHVKLDAPLMESRSTFKREYLAHVGEDARSSRQELVPKPPDTQHLILPPQVPHAPHRGSSSSYNEEFSASRYGFGSSKSAASLRQAAPDLCGRRTLAQVAAAQGRLGRQGRVE